jgi:hypothetical protein
MAEKINSLPILTVKACSKHTKTGPGKIVYCGEEMPSFIAVPIRTYELDCEFCNLKVEENYMVSSSQKVVHGDLKTPGYLKFNDKLHVKGDVVVDEIQVNGDFTVDGDFTSRLRPTVYGNMKVGGKNNYE